MNYTRRGLLIFALLMTGSGYAQEMHISLQQALDSAEKNNRELLIDSHSLAASREKFRQTQAVFLPQIKVSYTAMSTNNPLNAFGFKLQQQAITMNDFDPQRLNDPSSAQNFLTKAEWLQPVLNADMLMMRQAAQEQVNAVTFRSERTRQYVTFQVETAYAGLQLAHQARRVTEESLQTIKVILRSAENRYEKGYLQKSDVLQVQVQTAIAESRLAEAKSNVENASDQLGLLMGTSSRAVYRTDSLYVADTQTPEGGTVPDNRLDFLAMESMVSAQEKTMRSAKLGYVPKLNAFGEYLINDREAFGFSSNSYLVGAQLSWTLFNGMATRHKFEEQRIDRDKARHQLNYEKEKARAELDKAIRQWRDALTSSSYHELAVVQAEESLRIVQNRYQHGLVPTTELLQAQTLLLQQQLNWAQAVFQLNTATAYLHFLTTSEK